MLAGAALSGRTLVVTRPTAQAGELAKAIEAAGGKALCIPLLDIAPIAESEALRAAGRHLAEYCRAIFISPNAVRHGLPTLLQAGQWPAATRPVAIGEGTVKALASRGIVGCLVPAARFDSETLLELPEMATEAVAGRRILILRGDGGRELLAQVLGERGAQVDCVACYRRSPPAAGYAALTAALLAGQVDGVVISSSEALRYLVAGLQGEARACLAGTPLFVPHPRIAETARTLGLQQVIETAPADAGVLAGMIAHAW